MALNMTFTQENFTSNVLFELQNAKEYLISDDLQKFLMKEEYPWRALGAPLVKFVEECVAKIPQNERMQGAVSKNAYIENPEKVVISEGAVIEPGAYVTGAVFIEPHAVIRHGAYLRGPVYVSQYAIVGHATECKGSIFLPHAKAAHMNYVGDSILGYDCNLGAGTKLANLKLKHTNIFLYFDGTKIDSGLRKFGSIVGNHVSIGCNAVANPGTIFLPSSTLKPNQTALGVVRTTGAD